MKKCRIDGCENQCEPKRRYCRQHYLERKRKQAYTRFLKHGRYMYDCICCVCGKTFRGFRKHAKFCSKRCSDKFVHVPTFATNNYERAHGGGYSFLHRKLAEDLLGKLGYNIIAHHIDYNPMHNSLDNLIVLTRSDHVKLHKYLDAKRRSLVETGSISKREWLHLTWPITKEWLQTLNKPYIRLSEIDGSSKEILEKMRIRSIQSVRRSEAGMPRTLK